MTSSRRNARTFLMIALGALVAAFAGTGCVYGLDYEGQPDEEGTAEWGKLTCGDSGMMLLAIDGEPVKYPSLGPVGFDQGGFSVRVEPGVRAFHLKYAPINTGDGDIGDRRREYFGPPQLLTLTIEAGIEVKLKPREVQGGRRWEVIVEETKPLND